MCQQKKHFLSQFQLKLVEIVQKLMIENRFFLYLCGFLLLSSLHFGLYNYPYFDKSAKTSQIKRKTTLSTDETISELSSNKCNNQHFIIPPPIDENDCISAMKNVFKHSERNTDVVNVGIPIPLMLITKTSNHID